MTWTIALFGFLFSMVPYLLVAWGYTELTHIDAKTFWTAFTILLGARLLVAVIESIRETAPRFLHPRFQCG